MGLLSVCPINISKKQIMLQGWNFSQGFISHVCRLLLIFSSLLCNTSFFKKNCQASYVTGSGVYSENCISLVSCHAFFYYHVCSCLSCLKWWLRFSKLIPVNFVSEMRSWFWSLLKAWLTSSVLVTCFLLLFNEAVQQCVWLVFCHCYLLDLCLIAVYFISFRKFKNAESWISLVVDSSVTLHSVSYRFWLAGGL